MYQERMIALVKPRTYVEKQIDEAIDLFLDHVQIQVDLDYAKPATLNTYRQHLEFGLRYFKDMVVEDIDGTDMDSLLRHYVTDGDKRRKDPSLGPKKALASQNIFLGAWSSFFLYAKRQGWCTDSPMGYMSYAPKNRKETNPKRQALDADKVSALYGRFVHPGSDAHWSKIYKYTLDRLIFQLLVGTGIRNAEARSLKREDMSHVGDQSFLEVTGKGSKHRSVPLSPSLYQQIQDYLALRYRLELEGKLPASDYLLISSRGKSLSYAYIGRMLETLGQGVGFRTPVPHALRHTYATNLLRSGVDVASVRDLLGHANVSTTSVYLDTDSTQLYEELESKGVL